MTTRGRLAEGESVVLVDTRGRRYLKILKRGHRLTVRGTVLEVDSIVGRDEGVLVGRGEPERFRVFRPSYAELAVRIQRAAEPVFAKDAGLMIMRGDIRAGDSLVEVGAGTGVLTLALLGILGSGGSLTSYELREDFAAQARHNITLYHGEAPNWALKVRDARNGIDERGVDHVLADVPEPASLLDPAADALRPGGSLIAYVPTVGQFEELRERLGGHPAYTGAETWEALERSWHVEPPSVRPDHRMVAHTGFVTLARRIPH
jgi:tRNA (adenine57-N1/adenine58-N1)-methyltransferase